MIASMPEHIRQLLQCRRQQFAESDADNRQFLESLDQTLQNQLDTCAGFLRQRSDA
jgi:hypothetical protein